MKERSQLLSLDSNRDIKYKIIVSVLSAIILVFLFVFVWNYISAKLDSQKAIPTCGDGSFYNTCDLNKPYYCDAATGMLVENASICGCPAGTVKSENSCISPHQTSPQEVSLPYTLRGEEKTLNFTVYGGMADYISNLSKIITYRGSEVPLRSDFFLRDINDPEQRQLLIPLLVAIQNSANDKSDQVRIAISLVQNIPFGSSTKLQNFPGKGQVSYSRYPYEVLYDDMGICGEKSELLAFLLKEMGYGTVSFYFPTENHEAVGIKCPSRYSFDNTGYCFIETTGPSIMTDSGIEYVGGVKLHSMPEIILVSNGDSLGTGMYEYADAKEMMSLRNGNLILFRGTRLNKLRDKYGLVETYNSG